LAGRANHFPLLGSKVSPTRRLPSTAIFRFVAVELYLETKGVLFSTSPKPFNPFGL
jgi:hypothetical protein